MSSKTHDLTTAVWLYNFSKRPLQFWDSFAYMNKSLKLLRTSESDINVVTECQLNFHFQLPSVLLEKRREKFVNVYGAT